MVYGRTQRIARIIRKRTPISNTKMKPHTHFCNRCTKEWQCKRFGMDSATWRVCANPQKKRSICEDCIISLDRPVRHELDSTNDFRNQSVYGVEISDNPESCLYCGHIGRLSFVVQCGACQQSYHGKYCFSCVRKVKSQKWCATLILGDMFNPDGKENR